MIAPLNVSHLPAIRAIAQESFPVVWNEKDFAYFLAHECSYGRGIFEGAALQAYLVGLLVQGELDIASLATRSSLRRQGLAKQLVKQAQTVASVQKITLEVDAANEAAIGLYGACGFVKVGTRAKYYQGKSDALQMIWIRQPSQGGVLPTTPRTQG